jgi:hypothetical protein
MRYSFFYEGCTDFPKCRSHVKILDTIRMTRRKFDSEDLQILGAIIKGLVARASWRRDLFILGYDYHSFVIVPDLGLAYLLSKRCDHCDF